MTSRDAKPENHNPLRSQAEALLQAGTAPISKTGALGANALSLLHGMAKAPENASAALKFLHELQVHQVELDLQHEQLERSQDRLNLALERYVERFDFAPVGYLAVDRDGRILEGNLAAADLLGVERDALNGRRIDSLVTTQYRFPLLGLVKRLCNGSQRETCEAQVDGGGGVVRQVQIVATTLPSDGCLMMVLIEAITPRID